MSVFGFKYEHVVMMMMMMAAAGLLALGWGLLRCSNTDGLICGRT